MATWKYKAWKWLRNSRLDMRVRGHYLSCWFSLWQEKRARRAYERQWPRFCRDCDGWGGHTCPGGYDTPPEFDPCEALTDERTCHRCGQLGLTAADAEGPCTFCGWDYNDGAPAVEGCYGECDWRYAGY